MAYSCDLSGLPPDSVTALEGLDVWIIDALRDKPHPSHLSVSEALDWIESLKPKRAILTNLHTDLDYDELRSRLPSHVEPAYDGLTHRTAGRVSSCVISGLSSGLLYAGFVHTKIFHNIPYANWGMGPRLPEPWFRGGVDCHQGVRLARHALLIRSSIQRPSLRGTARDQTK